MLSREDFSEYLKEIQAIERNMVALYRKISEFLPDGDIKDTILSISRDEAKHTALVQEMRTILAGD